MSRAELDAVSAGKLRVIYDSLQTDFALLAWKWNGTCCH
jgi:hypothetical protein